jgi:predicted amidohydrolase YtcJ
VKLLIARAAVNGRLLDLRIADGVVTEQAERLRPVAGEEVIDADGGGLIPGLHDHHVHLMAMAAAAASLICGPPEVTDRAELHAALHAADRQLPPGEDIRGVGYHESVAGDLDRVALDEIVPDRAVRLQHRSGGLWLLNSAAVAAIDGVEADGLELDGAGRPTGRLWRADHVIRRGRTDTLPDLTAVGDRLLTLGITGVTDATPDLESAAVDHLDHAATNGALPQSIIALGTPDGWAGSQVVAGPRKLLLADHDLPSLDRLTETIRHSHLEGRGVAVHCVTRESLLLTLAALDDAGSITGDRIEHAAVVPPEACGWLFRLKLPVVTQPRFVCERGDRYLVDVDPADVGLLYPYASLIRGGVTVAPSSDAPFAAVDPWLAMVTARDRRTSTGTPIGTDEAVDPTTVLGGYLSPGLDPGGPARTIQVGARADLCLLTMPLAEAMQEPSRDHVRAVVAGSRVWVS